MSRPVRTTLFWALVSGFVVFPGVVWLLTPLGGWPTALHLGLWAGTALYAVLLNRWSQTGIKAVFFPLALLFVTAVWPWNHGGYVMVLIGVWSWIRSGICFPQRPMRSIAAELITAAGGAALVATLMSGGVLQWSFGIWLFGLVQCLYFYIVPYRRKDPHSKAALDPFEQARRELEQVLEG